MADISAAIQRIFGQSPASVRPLSGGDIAVVSCVTMADGTRMVVKQPHPGQVDTTGIEARMLIDLKEKSTLPVPEILHQESGLLIMSYLDTGGRMNGLAEQDAARHIAALHSVTQDHYGLSFDTVIGPLPQPNKEMKSWVGFFRTRRLLYMGGKACDAGRIDGAFLSRIEQFGEKLDTLIAEPDAPALLHGDLWGGNILVADGKISGFIDPAIYYGHGEMDLAFSTLFGSFGDAFFAAYREILPIPPGFFEVRRDICNLWPLLVHVVLFGGGYISDVDRILRRHGV